MTTPQEVSDALRVAEAYCYDAGAANAAKNVQAIRDYIAALEQRAGAAEANAARLVHRVECLRGLCKSAVGYLTDAGADTEANRVFALIGDMEPPVDYSLPG